MNSIKQILKEALTASTFEEGEYGHSIYFGVPCTFACNGILNGCLDIEKEEDINRYQPEQLKNIILNLPRWDAEGRQLLKEEFPDEDENEPPLNDIIIYPDGSFSIGYDTGESPAGQLFLYVNYSAEQERNNELIYETY